MNQPADLTSDCPAALDAAPRPNLEPNERVVAACVAEGLNNAEIAQRLGATPGTVALAIAKCMRKLNVRTRGRIAIWAVEQGLYPSHQ